MSPRRPTPLPPSLRTAPFHVAQARAAGIGAGRLRSGDLSAPFHGVRVPAGSLTSVADRCRAVAVRMCADQVFCHATALELAGLPLPPGLPHSDELHIASPRPRRAPRAAGVVGHSLDPALVEVVQHGSLRAVHPVGAWCQLADQLSVRDLVILGDALMCRQRPWATPNELAAAVATFRGRGKRKLVAVLELVRPNTDSVPETELRLDIVDAGLPEPAVNAPVYDSTGQLIAIADLLFHEQRVIAEYDGEQHRTDDAQYARDVDRLDDLARADYRVIRVNKRHRGAHRRAVLLRIRAALIERGWQPAL